MPIDLTVGVAGATSYQWYLNGAAIADTTTNYSVTSSVVADSGTYTLDAANSGGVVTASIVVKVNAAPVYVAPTISTPPEGVVAEYLSDGSGYDFYVEPIPQTAPYNIVKFSVVAAGQDLTYQWYFNGTAIAGATSATYSFALTAITQIGTYKVVVSNPANQPVSAAATLTAVPFNITF
jgi:membrane carboxypeptidase/penicillin-binding protein PbpC